MNGIARYDDLRKIYETPAAPTSQAPVATQTSGGGDLFSRLVSRMMSKRRGAGSPNPTNKMTPGNSVERDLMATEKANFERFPKWIEYAKQRNLLDRPGSWRLR